jgi:hypothetical protein
MRNSLVLLLILAGPLLASEPGAEPTSTPPTASEAAPAKKASPPDLKGSESHPKKTAAMPQAHGRIREGRRPSTPSAQRPAYLFM